MANTGLGALTSCPGGSRISTRYRQNCRDPGDAVMDRQMQGALRCPDAKARGSQETPEEKCFAWDPRVGGGPETSGWLPVRSQRVSHSSCVIV